MFVWEADLSIHSAVPFVMSCRTVDLFDSPPYTHWISGIRGLIANHVIAVIGCCAMRAAVALGANELPELGTRVKYAKWILSSVEFCLWENFFTRKITLSKLNYFFLFSFDFSQYTVFSWYETKISSV